ncbi:MAG: hypothetical protein AVW06_03405 [Hadesarchaea archaeon DG-33-1]|nr:MAG: hypothetical protein AVW06_03405 [Hadesarchaea archaeon DG-33-1]
MKSKSVQPIVIFIGILMSLNLVPLTNAQPYGGAYFTSIKVIHAGGEIELVNGRTAKVYDNLPMLINLRFYNENLEPSANLYTKVYIDNELQHTSGDYHILKGRSGSDIWLVSSSGPAIQRWKVELWWGSNLEDAKEFDVWVVKLLVSDWSPAPLTVEKGKTAPSSWPINFKNDGNDNMGNVSISVVDPAGLEITPQSQNLDNVITEETKSTSFSVTAPFTLTTGPRTVKLQITYDDFMGISHAEIFSASVDVTKLSTSITLSVEPSRIKKDDPCTITAKLVAGNGNPMANQTISFSVEATSIGSVNTDSFGNAVKTYTANVDAGTYVISASFGGSADYEASTKTTDINVEPFKTTLTLEVLSAFTLKATLKDEKGNPLQTMDVEFQISEENVWKRIGSAKTDPRGIASIEHEPSTAGTFKIKAIFAGTKNYEASSAIAELIAKKSIVLKLGIIMVVAVTIVALLVFARKRGMKIPFVGRKEEIGERNVEGGMKNGKGQEAEEAKKDTI